MKVEHVVPTSLESQPEILYGVDNNKADGSDLNIHDRAILVEPQSSKNTFIRPSEEYDVDLAFEHDELLDKSEPHTISQGPKVWQVKLSSLKFSALEATVAVKRGLYTYDDLALYSAPPPRDSGPSDPITGALSAALGTIGTIAQRTSDYPLLLAKVLEAKEDEEVRTEIAEFAKDSSKGVSGMVGAGLKAPMEISMNISRGFHNLPKMYGDEVREVERVVDVQSGLKAAGKGFGLGLWDGVSGLITQPVNGAQEGGFMGGLVGLGKGIGGAVFKPAAGAFGIPGYAFKGIYEEVQKTKRLDVEDDIVEALMLQGFREWEGTTEDERNLIFVSIKRDIEDLETLEG